MNIFGIATREKYRFPYNGQISVEDLWDLSREQLDKIFKALNAQKKSNEEESLCAQKSKDDETLLNKIELVKYIFEQKQAEAEAHLKEKARAEKRQQILGLIAKKQNEQLENLSKEELEKMLEEL